MSDTGSRFDRLKREAAGLAARVRPRHLVGVVAVAGVAVVLASLNAVALPGPRPVLDGDRMQIQVVAPTEPEITPGAVMEVGELVDGFEYVPPAPPEAEPALWAPSDDEFDPPASLPSGRKSDFEDARIDAPAPPEPPRRERVTDGLARWFGFDAPERDYRAEREARRARREAPEQARDDRFAQWYRDEGPPPDDRD